jgi:hypothetical protein
MSEPLCDAFFSVCAAGILSSLESLPIGGVRSRPRPTSLIARKGGDVPHSSVKTTFHRVAERRRMPVRGLAADSGDPFRLGLVNNEMILPEQAPARPDVGYTVMSGDLSAVLCRPAPHLPWRGQRSRRFSSQRRCVGPDDCASVAKPVAP